MLGTAPGGFTAPSPPVLSCVTGETSYNSDNSREILNRWVDHPQRVWDVVNKTLAAGVETIIQWFTGEAVTGFATVNLLLLIIGSMLMIGLGIIGEYIAKIYDEVKGRPRYVVAETAEPRTAETDPAARR